MWVTMFDLAQHLFPVKNTVNIYKTINMFNSLIWVVTYAVLLNVSHNLSLVETLQK